ncbi:MAG: hypothetical protein Q9195_004042 [Heterodermia aff. obscurata]
MSNSANRTGIVPACLSYLAIYNPSLSNAEESLHDQIVYYYSKADGNRTGRKSASNTDIEQENRERNEQLRQIGLAQGMVEFAKGFSDGQAVDSIETEKSRIILHELETGWWILASVALTRIISAPEKSPSEEPQLSTEYSGREVAPPILLLQQVLRAHRTFLLHHGASLDELYIRMTRSKFCSVLKRFWNHFIFNWDVLLNGNPALGLFNGLKLAAGGELGVGVGEEDWGSGEREVLEAFIGRTEGLVDMTVSRFGDAPSALTSKTKTATVASQTASEHPSTCWRADGQHPRPSDGIVFSGIGTLDRTSIRDISCWAEDLFRYGRNTYGVKDSPSSMRSRRRADVSSRGYVSQLQRHREHDQRGIASQLSNQKHSAINTRQNSPNGHGIPRPLINTSKSTSQIQSTEPSELAATPEKQTQKIAENNVDRSETGTETMMKYLTLGVYGSAWGIPFRRPLENSKISKLRNDERAQSSSPGRVSINSGSSRSVEDDSGYFLIGYRGELESDVEVEKQADETDQENADRISDENQDSSTMLRTLHVRRQKRKLLEGDNSSETQGTSAVAAMPIAIIAY